MYQRSKYLNQKVNFDQTLLSGLTDTHTNTHRTNCSTWTTKKVGKFV